MIPSAATLDSLRAVGDPPADAVIGQLFEQKLVKDANSLFAELTRNNHLPDANHAAAPILANFLQFSSLVPDFADQALLDCGADFFQSHGPQILTVLGAYSLPLDYAARKGVQVLARTGRLSGSPNRRIVETAQMLTDMMQKGAFRPEGGGIRAIQKLRLIHAAVRHMIRTQDRTWRDEYGTPINQEDLAGTLLSFSCAVLDGLQRLGMPPAAADAEAYYHCFRVAGHLMGIQPQLIAPTLAEAKELALLIRERQFFPSPEGQEMTAALLRLMEGAYPWPLQGTGPALMRHLLEDKLADMLGVPKSPWATRELNQIQQSFYVRAEAAANSSTLVCELRHTVSQWYLSHLEIIDRGGGRGQLQIPDHLKIAWKQEGTAKGASTRILPQAADDLPRAVHLRSIVHPVDRNNKISQSYHELSVAMGRLLGEPPVADWCTYAKFASHQAGVHIRETSSTAAELLSALFDTSEPRKLQRLAEQISLLPAQLSMARSLLNLCLQRSRVVDGIDAVRHSQRPRLITALGDFRAAAARLNRTFFVGNLRVYENIAPVYATYLRAARLGKHGIPDQVPACDSEADPAGYMQRGFACYREAQLAYHHGDVKRRDELVYQGSLWLGLHEQGCVLQPLFDGVRDELRALSDNISITDPRGQTRMLPRGGDWGDLLDRMAIDRQRTSPEPWTELPPLRSDAELDGTIAGYFRDGLHSEVLIRTRPEPIYPMLKGIATLPPLLEEEQSIT